jgi:ketose-bisphosphate aldolase
MPLRPLSELLSQARQHHYALGYFESWNFESLQGVLDAAEATRSPVIIGFNGEFLSSAHRKVPERLECYAALGRAAANATNVPCGFIFNECPNDEWVRNAVLAGFNLVMPADPGVSYDDYARRVTSISIFAHQHGVAVEAELGHLPFGLPSVLSDVASAKSEASAKEVLTDPEAAARFVKLTGIDLLAISVGNVHVMQKGERDVDLDLISRIAQRTDKPLVLHGGTGISQTSLQEAIRLGVHKVNYGTYLKRSYLHAVRAAVAVDDENPHELLGMGGDHDIMIVGRMAVRDAVLERIETLGCCGKAD